MRFQIETSSLDKWLKFTIPALIFVISWNVFLWRIDTPRLPYFDEVRYVSAAKQLLSAGVNENWSHPPLGKELIGAGIALAGDSPAGWRIMSSLFGAASLVLMYLWGLTLFRRRTDGVLIAFLCLVNQVHFVQSRIAMLDVFMFTFIIAGLVCFSNFWLDHDREISLGKNLSLLILSGIAFGLGGACKWFAAIPALICLFLCLNSGVKLGKARWVVSPFAFLIVPIAIYFSLTAVVVQMAHPTYAPPLKSEVNKQQNEAPESKPPSSYSLNDLIPLQLQMLRAHWSINDNHTLPHPYQSSWLTWPFLIRPIWYDLGSQTINDQRELSGILFIGNPLIFFPGLFAIFICLFAWWKRDLREAGLVVLFYFGMWASWAFLRPERGFLFYYYPAAMILSPAIVMAIRILRVPPLPTAFFLALCGACFVFYYPLLTDVYLREAAFFARIPFKSWL